MIAECPALAVMELMWCRLCFYFYLFVVFVVLNSMKLAPLVRFCCHIIMTWGQHTPIAVEFFSLRHLIIGSIAAFVIMTSLLLLEWFVSLAGDMLDKGEPLAKIDKMCH